MPILTQKMKIAIVAVFCLLILFLTFGGILAWAQTYDGRMGPGTFVGPVKLSGLDPEQAAEVLQKTVDEMYASGAPVLLGGASANVPLSMLVGSDSVDAVRFDVDGTITRAFNVSHNETGAAQTWEIVSGLLRPNKIEAIVSADENRLREAVRAAFPNKEQPPSNASFDFQLTGSVWSAEVVEGVSGNTFDFEPFLTKLLSNLAKLDKTPTALAIVHQDPEVSVDQARLLVNRALDLLSRKPNPLQLVMADSTGTTARSWTIEATALSAMLVPGTNETLALDKDAFAAFLDPIAATIETQPVNARFIVTDGRVTDFVSSSDGLSIDRNRLDADLSAALNAGDAADVTLAFQVVKPEIDVADANDMGIGDMLGSGTSSYRGSPTNRIKNIGNGVRLLNGLLIAPDETFSLLNALKPFETENGYLPELVIKGDKIQPEIGGGLCQIGTTTFRAAMNSGLPIVSRSNHSLVVSYYNDPANGNPGTDATIYDPAPDFQFKNDTGHYLLFQAEMDETTQNLRFTFWGTSDGRKGSYTPPTVIRWIGVGDPINTETLDLEPGEKKCQSAHVGADTTFTYSVVRPDGTVETTGYPSHYRPLPEICLVGVEELSTPDGLQPATDDVSSTEAAEAPVPSDTMPQPDAQTKTE